MAFTFGTKNSDRIETENSHDLIFAWGGNDYVDAAGGNDTIFGGRGNDTLNGGAGADLVFGGRGQDLGVFVMSENRDNGRKYDFYDGGRGQDSLRLELTAGDWMRDDVRQDILAYLAHLEADNSARKFYFASLKLTVRRFEDLQVLVDGDEINPQRDPPVVIYDPNSSDDLTIITGSGDDTITTGSGDDTIDSGDGDDVIDSGSGNDLIKIGDGDDVVRAGPGNDTIIAGSAGGNDFLDFGPGSDTVEYPSLSAEQPVRIDLRPMDRSGNAAAVKLLVDNGLAAETPVGLADGGDYVDTDVLISAENAVGGLGNDSITGSEENNLLVGLSGDDVIFGLGGEDTLRGDVGNDTLDGGADGDVLIGGAGNDSIDGGIGFDQLVFVGALSEYSFANANGIYIVIDSVEGRDGTDTFRNLERLVFADATVSTWTVAGTNEIFGDDNRNILNGSDGRDRLYGRGGDDVLNGWAEEDQFIGGPGNDTIDGGSGTADDANFVWDIVDYSQAEGDGILNGVSVNLGSGVSTDPYGDTDTLIDIERVFGTNFDDLFLGSDDSSEIEVFDPFGGNDIIHGGDGSDWLSYQIADKFGGFLGIVVEFSSTVEGSGTVLIDPFGDRDEFTGIEVITATRFDDQITGGIGDNFFATFDGIDTIDGGAGRDQMDYSEDANYGGFGAVSMDLAIVDAAGYAEATDGFGKSDLLRDIENIRGTGGADDIRGDGAANRFRGEAGDDILEGRGGDDNLQGGLGKDILNGGAGADFLDGGLGDDELTGGANDDFLRGGVGGDKFIFNAGDGTDTIEDFQVGEDIIVLNGGLTITSLTEADIGGEVGPDTIVTLSSSEDIYLWNVTDVTDPNSLLTL